MNAKFVISAVLMAVLSLALGFVVHGWLLVPEYHGLSSLFRSETDAQSYFPFMIVAHILYRCRFHLDLHQGS